MPKYMIQEYMNAKLGLHQQLVIWSIWPLSVCYLTNQFPFVGIIGSFRPQYGTENKPIFNYEGKYYIIRRILGGWRAYACVVDGGIQLQKVPFTDKRVLSGLKTY